MDPATPTSRPRSRRRFTAAFTLLFAVMTAILPASQADAGDLFAGACVIDLSATWSPTSLDLSTPVDGPCVVNGISLTGTLEADLVPFNPTTFDCSGGVGRGLVTFRVDGLDTWHDIDAVVVWSGPVIEVEFHEVSSTRHIVGAGTFVMSNPTVADICFDGVTSFDLQGAVVFEDPVLP